MVPGIVIERGKADVQINYVNVQQNVSVAGVLGYTGYIIIRLRICAPSLHL